MADIYKPAGGKRIPMPGNQADWPQEGRAINPLSGWERRLVADGDLVLDDDQAAAGAETAAANPASDTNFEASADATLRTSGGKK